MLWCSLRHVFSVAQVLNGDVENAICLHAFYYAIWKRFGALPERYNWQLQAPDVLFYPLRPELVESTYLLYQVQIFFFCTYKIYSSIRPTNVFKNTFEPLFCCRLPRILFIFMLGWTFLKALKRIPKSGMWFKSKLSQTQGRLCSCKQRFRLRLLCLADV